MTLNHDTLWPLPTFVTKRRMVYVVRQCAAVSVLIVLSALVQGCRTSAPSGTGPGGIELEGMASWYGQEFAGRPTANGEIFDPETMTAAHRTLPFGTILDVTNLKNGRTTRVRINDRGPFVGNRIIDLSYAAARSLEMVEDGISRVRLDIVRLGKGEREPPKPYAVKIESQPTEAVPVVPDEPRATAPPRPEPVRTIDEEPIETVELPSEPEHSTVVRQEPPAPTPAPPAPQPSVRSGGWKIQVGAFGVEENARRFARELQALIPDSVYVEVIRGLHRVRIGPFKVRTDAIEARERIDAAGYESILLAPDNP